MMGNENSQLSGLKIDDKAIEITDLWSHYQATINDSCRYFSLKNDGSVSVFKGEVVLGPLWATGTPLAKCSNNLLKFRHPCIVRYLSSWQQRSTFHLVTEYVQPLSHMLAAQTPLQICIGLNNILRALVFLHEQAGVSHNNVSVSSIYVSGDSQWKLGGLQYLCKFSDLNPTYLKHARIHRYDKAVDPDEESHEHTSKVDQYGFAVLVEDVFKDCKDDDVPYLQEFRKYCKNFLQNNDPTNRPILSEILKHNFFNHEFITIYKFLNFLPLKKEEDKCQFFSNILTNLKRYDEETVAKQFSGLLLSRLTLLDSTARKDVIPYILKPKNERLHNGEQTGFFSLNIFKEHVKPRLLQLFGVRDGQVRMLLLKHFTKFLHVFSHEELSQHILPELLLGIKDIDDNLVASTLVCLSELVPILENIFDATAILTYEKTMTLNERPSPVGGESNDIDIIVEASKNTVMNSEEEWDDWDNTKHKQFLHSDEHISTSDSKLLVENEFDDANVMLAEKIEPSTSTLLLHKAAIETKRNMVDITELDIKNQKVDCKKNADEFDFFADMTPIIEKQKVLSVATSDNIQDISSKLIFEPDEEGNDDGWGESWS
ncbi:unnamed protein product, partial [Iphiclides podalirius]